MFARMPVISCTLKEFISFDGYPLSPKKSRHASLGMAEERHAQLLTWREQHQRVLTLQDVECIAVPQREAPEVRRLTKQPPCTWSSCTSAMGAITPNERSVAEDRRDCYTSSPTLTTRLPTRAIRDSAQLPWREVTHTASRWMCE
jgi:hypothetical protein